MAQTKYLLWQKKIFNMQIINTSLLVFPNKTVLTNIIVQIRSSAILWPLRRFLPKEVLIDGQNILVLVLKLCVKDIYDGILKVINNVKVLGHNLDSQNPDRTQPKQTQPGQGRNLDRDVTWTGT